MRRLAWSQLRFGIGRTVALLAGMALAAAAFTVLTAASRTSQLRTVGTVSANFRPAYDILVRPPGARTGLETQTGTVAPNFLSGIFGGISMARYHQIERIPGVQVAAPVAMIGYVLQDVRIPVDLTPVLAGGTRLLFTFVVGRRTDRGLTSFPADESGYVYVTPDRLTPLSGFYAAAPAVGPEEQLPGGKTVAVCAEPGTPPLASGPFDLVARTSDSCWSLADGLDGQGWTGQREGTVAALIDWPFPFLLAAVDPAAEARLAGLKGAVVSGRYLTTADKPVVRGSGTARTLSVPVLVSTRAYQDDTDDITVRRPPAPDAQQMTAGLSPGQLASLLQHSQSTAVLHAVVGTGAAYQRLLAVLRGGGASYIDSYWTVGAVEYRRTGPGAIRAVPVTNPVSAWASNFQATGYVVAPIDNQDTAFRRLQPHVGNSSAAGSGLSLPQLHAVGEYDPAKLPGFSPLSGVPLGAYSPPVAGPGNQRAARLLGGADLLPNGNLAGYLQSPPLMLTTLRSIPAFTSPAVFSHTDDAAPLSAIRVRVAGVTGPNPVSLERIKLVAQQIAVRTHLDVDIVAGSSPKPTTVALPAGAFGRPGLELAEWWVRKGVAVAILTAVDAKSVLLFTLILVVCALFVANSATAAVRGRRRELGVLACLGWTRPRLFGVVLGELAWIGLAAGILGGAVALPVAAALGLHAAPQRAVLALPVAMAVAVAAGAVPAWVAARAIPLACVRPPITTGRRGHHPGGVTALAVLNVARTPGRTLAGVASLAVGVAALTLLVAVMLAFRGVVVGSLLGNAVAVEVRGVDYVAVAATLAIGVLAIADIVFLNIRERAAELATIRSFGWPEPALARLVITEGTVIGIAGSLAGAGLGLAAAAEFAGPPPAGAFAAAAAAAAAGVLVTAAASLLPARLLRRVPAATLLAEE
jgi:hypothetical protein